MLKKDMDSSPSKGISVALIAKRNISQQEQTNSDQIAEALLQLTHVRLDRENLKCIDNLECLGNVTNLYLQHNNIEYIENLETLQQLNFLTLASNKISEVKNLKCLNKLKFLDLSDNNITEFSTDEFPSELLILNLQGNPCLQSENYRSCILKALPHLKQLDGATITNKDRREVGFEVSSTEDDSEEESEDDIEEEKGSSLKQHCDNIIVRAKIRAIKEDASHGRRLEELASIRAEALHSSRPQTQPET
ncbi:leucine-rich repeat-containing protein 46 isoform X2 [Nematostella vectensis]|uniref:leucine-rich repeat-containing protein 46 isoform X2 n=1 Tax=Nematostella vectensis TaxID=45351 RepID=UPI00138FE568|nr:leucine-rich repeat-containing protein 46 isoform X2 [Nematostella vectensis]